MEDLLFDMHEQYYVLILNGGEGRWKDEMVGSVIFGYGRLPGINTRIYDREAQVAKYDKGN